MSSAEISQQLNLTSIKDHGWHIQVCCVTYVDQGKLETEENSKGTVNIS